MADHDPNHIFRKAVWNNYNVGPKKASSGGVTPVSQRDPNHIFRKGFWDSYNLQGKAGAAGSGGSGGSAAKKKKAKAKHVAYSRHPIAAAAMRDVWGHRGMASGQG